MKRISLILLLTVAAMVPADAGTEKVLQGTAVVMQNPLIDMAAQPVDSALVRIVTYSSCFIMYSLNGLIAPADTQVCSTRTDAMGRFSVTLPDSQLQYEAHIQARGYAAQTVPVNPGDAAIMFELIPAGTVNPAADLTVTVTENGEPAGNVYVSLTAGHRPCLLYAADALPPQPADETAGYTDSAGVVVLHGLPLDPYIDYYYQASRYSVIAMAAPIIMPGDGFSEEGFTRLYDSGLYANTLQIDVITAGMADNANPRPDRVPFTVSPQPLAGAGIVTPAPWCAAVPGMELVVHGAGGAEALRIPVGARGAVLPAHALRSGVYAAVLTDGNRIYGSRLLVVR